MNNLPQNWVVIVSDEEEEPGEMEDNKNWDPDYKLFFDEPLSGDPRKT